MRICAMDKLHMKPLRRGQHGSHAVCLAQLLQVGPTQVLWQHFHVCEFRDEMLSHEAYARATP